MENTGLPDADHIGKMFDAYEDLVSGTEGLTPAIIYAGGVLYADGSVGGGRGWH